MTTFGIILGIGIAIGIISSCLNKNLLAFCGWGLAGTEWLHRLL